MIARLAAVLALAGASVAAAAAPPREPPPVTVRPFPERAVIAPVMDCDALAKVDFAGIPDAPAVIHSTAIEAATAERAEFCLVKGRVAPQVGFELRLPTRSYTGRYLQGGCGGNCGFIGTSLSPSCDTKRAYAGAFALGFNDAGHAAPTLDALWATNDGLREDFGHRGPHRFAVAAKAIITAFYGQAPRYSYFQGCSNGGREGLMAVQRYPGDFDGVIAGASNYLVAEKVERYLWEAQHGIQEDGSLVFTDAAARLLHAAVMKECDGRDGLVDGQIDDPRRCRFDPAALLCKPGFDRPGFCLSARQVATAKAFYAGPTTPEGRKLFPGGEPYGTELTWSTRGAFAFAGRTAGESFVRFMLPEAAADRTFRAGGWRFDEAGLRRLQSAAPQLDARNPDLAAFRSRGGKLILWQGAADFAAGPNAIFEYYHAVRALSGGTAKAREFARLFLMPGVYHCRDGYIAYETDLIGTIVAWVESGTAPDSVESAARLDDGKIRRRPVFAYPVAARYRGKGDINSPDSFVGVAPASPPDDRYDWLGAFAADLPPS